eukprot:TRINITY_DN2876_c0_g1_i1.p1 TRINITY_DN2876_c0_g1~~TRINITY_DN2876_c0_g1_i1.p1  ORF type:complete len:555 (-),score=72.01 TRINITY_DN2876_c0_g1_i1:68-1732(-)
MQKVSKDNAIPFIVAWLKDSYALTAGEVYAKGELYRDYHQFGARYNVETTTAGAFGKIVRLAFPTIECTRKGPRGLTKHYYKNFAPKEDKLNRRRPQPIMSSSVTYSNKPEQPTISGSIPFTNRPAIPTPVPIAQSSSQSRMMTIETSMEAPLPNAELPQGSAMPEQEASVSAVPILPSCSSEIFPEFPFSASTISHTDDIASREKLRRLSTLYKSHMRFFLEVAESEPQKIEHLKKEVYQFWQAIGPTLQKLLARYSELMTQMPKIDLLYYNHILDVLLPDPFNSSLTLSQTLSILTIANNYTSWLMTACPAYIPDSVARAKLVKAKEFCTVLKVRATVLGQILRLEMAFPKDETQNAMLAMQLYAEWRFAVERAAPVVTHLLAPTDLLEGVACLIKSGARMKRWQGWVVNVLIKKTLFSMTPSQARGFAQRWTSAIAALKLTSEILQHLFGWIEAAMSYFIEQYHTRTSLPAGGQNFTITSTSLQDSFLNMNGMSNFAPSTTSTFQTPSPDSNTSNMQISVESPMAVYQEGVCLMEASPNNSFTDLWANVQI